MKFSVQDKEVFEKLDKEFELNQKIQNSFEEFHLVKQWHRLQSYLRHNLDLIKNEMSSIKCNDDGVLSQDSVVMFYDRINFHVFNFLNTAYAFRQSLFLPKEPSFNWKSKEKFDVKATDFKNMYSQKIVIGIRSRIKSGLQLDSTLNYEVRTIHHPRGDGFEIGFDLATSDWEKIKSELNASNKIIFDASKSKNRLLDIFELFVSDAEKVLTDMESIFNEVFSQKIKDNTELKAELAEVERYFSDKGFHRL
ncbi:hypothetical protein K2P97_00330 [bacterium]|nr:hypothetical protein [bacterium]